MPALLDADIIVYMASRAGTTVIDWEDGDDPTYVNDMVKARRIANDTVAAWTQGAGKERPILCFTDRSVPAGTFRYDLHPHYKGQRIGDRPPLFEEITEYLMKKYETVVMPYLEGDDVIGLMLTGHDGKKYVGVSTDKDMRAVPGTHFNPTKDKKPVKVSEQLANYNWMVQTLIGDTVDNYKGAPGAGLKKAQAVLSPRMTLSHLWETVLEVYDDQWSKERWHSKFICTNPTDEALLNAWCARILRDGDYNNGEIKLWTPNANRLGELTISREKSSPLTTFSKTT